MYDLSRFRVFLDSCILLFNKEKFDDEKIKKEKIKEGKKEIIEEKKFVNLGDYFVREFLRKKRENNEFRNFILDYIKKIKNNKGSSLLTGINEGNMNTPFKTISELEDEEKGKEPSSRMSMTKKLKTIRRGFAHMQYGGFARMQYGNYVFDERIYIFKLWNKDSKFEIRGIVFEPILHEFIEYLYSKNPNVGLLNKLTIIGKVRRISRKKYFFSIKDIKSSKIEDIKKNIQELSKNKYMNLSKYLEKNADKFEIKKKEITKLFYSKRIKKYFKENNLKKLEKDYFIKFLLDLEIELSNLLFHIIILNDTLIEYLISKKYNLLSPKKKEEINEQLTSLKEDETSKKFFKYMFVYLKSINILNRLEDKELKEVNNIEIEGFKIKTKKDFNRYVNDEENFENIKKFGEKKAYILDKFRNSLAHGTLKINLTENGEIIFNFIDKYKENKGIIEITFHNLEKFLSQEQFYKDIVSKHQRV